MTVIVAAITEDHGVVMAADQQATVHCGGAISVVNTKTLQIRTVGDAR